MGTENSKDKSANKEDCTANALSLPNPLRIAVSPPANMVKKIVGANKMKCRVWFPHEKVKRLSKGPKRAQIKAPRKAESRQSERTWATAWSIPLPISASETTLTPLVGIPRLEAEERKLEVELKRDSNPIPEGPRNIAVNLFLTTPTSIFSP